jgi:hypothetical protein
MGARYDDAKFGVVQRKWFGLTKKCGGDAASGFTFGTNAATVIDHVTRYYPKGPIKLLKFGALCLGTLSNTLGTPDKITARLYCDSGVEASIDLATDMAQYSISSVTTFTSATIGPGSYLAIDTATADTDKGTDANNGTMSGTVAFFIDYHPIYHQSKWDV